MTTKFVKEISIDVDILANHLLDQYHDLYIDFYSAVADLYHDRVMYLSNKAICIDFKENVVIPQFSKFKTFRTSDYDEINATYGNDLTWLPMTHSLYLKAIDWDGNPFFDSNHKLKFINSNVSILRFAKDTDAVEKLARMKAADAVVSAATGVLTATVSMGLFGAKKVADALIVEKAHLEGVDEIEDIYSYNVNADKLYDKEGVPVAFYPIPIDLRASNNEDLIQYFFEMNWIPRIDSAGQFDRFVKIYKCIKDCPEKTFEEKLINNVELIHEHLLDLDDEEIKSMLLEGDYKRAAHQPYHEGILYDINQGHWELWDGTTKEANKRISMTKEMVAKDPASSVVNGVVGIDFGTKSTVVVYQKDSLHSLPMRIGLEDLSRKVEEKHYENPTFMEFVDLEQFLRDYNAQQCRPYTKWESLLVSHSARADMVDGSTSKNFTSFFSELKLWAGSKDKSIKIVDQKGAIFDLPPYTEVDNLDPIEIYAYYLGLNINNLHNGIYLEYYLSFPVTYEVKIREKIAESFKRGIRKSLPQTLLDNETIMDKLSVHMGASEPAAYAVTALQNFNLEPDNSEKIFYSVFDFGGGTTDFDFGIWRNAEGNKERRFDYVIEHFGAGGDRFLGGENILSLLAFEVFKQNSDQLRRDNIVFNQPPETKEFVGSETLIANSREARLNMRLLSEKLRPFWERPDSVAYYDYSIQLNLFNKHGENIPGYTLDYDPDALEQLIRERIEKGVINFFESVRRAFSHHENETAGVDDQVHIFLAGNASKSVILREIMDEYIDSETRAFLESIGEDSDREVFKLYPPLGTEEAYDYFDEHEIEYEREDFNKPTAKTGVAFGLVDCRKGSKIKVVDRNVKEDIHFKYYLGEVRKGKFNTVIDRNEPYFEWKEFIDAGESTFEVYYTDQPKASTGSLSGTDVSVKYKRLDIDVVDEDLLVYIRLVSPTVFEYVVSSESCISKEDYKCNIVRVELG